MSLEREESDAEFESDTLGHLQWEISRLGLLNPDQLRSVSSGMILYALQERDGPGPKFLDLMFRNLVRASGLLASGRRAELNRIRALWNDMFVAMEREFLREERRIKEWISAM
eukprot:4935571-Pyramimonas_sp.AAC.1